MSLFDRRFVNPSVAQLLESLGDASEHAGLPRDADTWQEHLAGVRRQPEGVEQWGGSFYTIFLAWWTDARKRRHFRVQSKPAGGEESDQFHHSDSDLREPVWYVYPEWSFRKNHAGYVHVCACGRAGAAEALGWMGDRCGTCHDDPARAPHRPAGPATYLHNPGLRAERVAFSHDGRFVAIAGAEPVIDIWDRLGRILLRRLEVGPGRTMALAFSHDDEPWLAVSRDDGLLRFLDAATGRPGVTIPTPATPRQVEFIPRCDLLLMLTERSVEFWGRATTSGAWELLEEGRAISRPVFYNGVGWSGEEQQVEDLGASARRVAISRGGRWVALASSNLVCLWEVVEGRPALHWMHRDEGEAAISLAFHGTSQELIGVWSRYEERGNSSRLRIRTWGRDRSEGEQVSEVDYNGRSPILDPYGRWVASRDELGINLLDTESMTFTLSLEDHPCRSVESIWFAPDGQSLASIDDIGRVRLWPWRALLNA